VPARSVVEGWRPELLTGELVWKDDASEGRLPTFSIQIGISRKATQDRSEVWVRFPGTWQVRLGWCRLIDSRTTAEWAMPPGGAWTQDCSGASREPQARRLLEGGSARGCRGGACPHHARRRCRLRRRGVWVTACLAHNCEAERRSPLLARHDRTTCFTMRSPS